jgi:predicted enzyme related to lactoylglutathione lyase
MSNRVVHFEIHCPNLDGATKFYEQLFGWQLTSWPGPEKYVLAKTGAADKRGIDGGLMPSRDGEPRTVNTIQVDSVDDSVKKAVSLGGQNVVPKMPIPGVGWLAYCTDPGGNIFGMMTPDANAK